MLRRERLQHFARIRVIGVGSGGSRTVERLMTGAVHGVDFITIDTESQPAGKLRSPTHITVDRKLIDWVATTPDLNRAKQLLSVSAPDLCRVLAGSHLVFIISGLGGETGSHLAPVVAGIARELGGLTIGIVSLPFTFEGERRMTVAVKSVEQLKHGVDTLIAVPNERVLALTHGQVAFHETYRLTDEICRQSIQGVSEIVNVPGLINVDFADVRAIIAEGGAAIITSGCGRGSNRARLAAEQATVSNLLGLTIDGARGVLFNIRGGPDMTLQEVCQAAAIITGRADPDANLIFGTTVHSDTTDEIQITLLATGVGETGSEAGLTSATGYRAVPPRGMAATEYVKELLLEDVALDKAMLKMDSRAADCWPGNEKIL